MTRPHSTVDRAPDVTVVMSPRERFSHTLQSIESLYRDQRVPFHFICIDGGAPRSVARRLDEEQRRRDFRLIRTPYFLTENQARNLAIPEVTTKYIAFVDNDVEFAPGWLEALCACAEETGAAIVSPVVCWGEPVHTTIHFAGGSASIALEGGERRFRESHWLYDRRLAEVQAGLVRQPSELAEFHCMLVRRDTFDRVGLLDEELKSIHEHTDFCLRVRAAGGSVMFEPKAVITYVMGARLGFSDLVYFFYRWNHDWSLASDVHFHKKWGTVFSDQVTSEFTVAHRRRAWSSLRKAAEHVVGWRGSLYLYDMIASGFVRVAQRRQNALARAARPN
jgi:GT2 family glycosyltransferase